MSGYGVAINRMLSLLSALGRGWSLCDDDIDSYKRLSAADAE